MTLRDTLTKALQSTTNYEDFRKAIGKEKDYCKRILDALDEIPQFHHWHPEVSVAKHTYYVCKAIFEFGYDSLLEAGFLHDVGKRWTTNVGAKKIWHYNHPKVSVDYINIYAEKLELELSNLEFTKNIVLHHMDKKMNSDKLKELGKKFEEGWLWFGNFDKVRAKELYMKESTLFERYMNKVKQQWMFFKKKHFSKKKLYVMVGISGSGKSTIAKKMFREEVIVSSDALRKELSGNIDNQGIHLKVFDVAFVRLIQKLELHGKAVLDATNVDKGKRIGFFGKDNAFFDTKKIALVVPCGIDIAYDRIRKDIDNKVERSNVPFHAIKNQAKKFGYGFESLFDEFEEVKIWNADKQKFERVKR